MAESKRAQLKDLLESFDTAMLITRHGEEMHARPMAVAGVEGENTLWFVTSNLSPKFEEIRTDQRVSVTLQGRFDFVALSGEASLVDDRGKIEQLWQTSWKAWFPDGKDDPKLSLIRVAVTDAEFWDMAGTKGIRYVFEVAKALVTGDTPDIASGQHGRVRSSNVAPASKPH